MNNLQRVTLACSQMSGAFHEMAKALHLSDSTLSILYTLRLFGGEMALRTLQEAAELPKQTVNSALRKLEGDGLVRTEPLDGKSRKVLFTAQGEEMARHKVDQIIAVESGMLRSWGPEKVAMYISLSEEYRDTLREAARAMGERGDHPGDPDGALK